MTKPKELLTARECVWEHRLRQRIVLERIVLEAGTPKEQSRAKEFLDAMEKAYPELLQSIAQQGPTLFDEREQPAPELFEESEYSHAPGSPRALKMPGDIAWEQRVVKRAVREFRGLLHPCPRTFENAMQGLQYLHSLHPELFARARDAAVAKRNDLLACDLYCSCECIPAEERQPAETFAPAQRSRFSQVQRRIAEAEKSQRSDATHRRDFWQFFLARIDELAPELRSA